MKRENLIEARKSKGLTQYELADALSIAEITVRKIENGDRNPSTKSAMEFSRYFNLDIKVLFPDIFLPSFDTKGINDNSSTEEVTL
ncbi:helix-turn-helix transcriptional regulator [Paucilactobacillus nenjiangensis]|uniref:Helix-turn-helix transcriptional regulator n=1 Tax=Paucilactobacillus nenjiangensis TaxID=1296540 RepID=A0A5P1X2G9_9LACO|nr:helix-turn-helix transcriptional regulator [Paucilactobacillus nenjiangensis]QER67605.1 helix-turn-helix transcriptional regulator [Paucilactobacillus nenjiangensis]